MSQPIMRRQGSVAMTKRQQFWVYAIVLCILIVPIWITVDAVTYFFTSIRSTRIQSANDIFWGGYFLVLPALLFYYIQKQHLQFHLLSVRLDRSQFLSVTLDVARQLEWQIVEHSDHHIVAKSRFTWRSFGERITIYRDGDQVLFNSVGNPNNFYTIPYAGLNKRFRMMFEELATAALANKRLKADAAVTAKQE